MSSFYKPESEKGMSIRRGAPCPLPASLTASLQPLLPPPPSSAFTTPASEQLLFLGDHALWLKLLKV